MKSQVKFSKTPESFATGRFKPSRSNNLAGSRLLFFTPRRSGLRELNEGYNLVTFQELVEKVQKVKCQEIRVVEDDYCEAVVASAQLSSIISVLQGYFGF